MARAESAAETLGVDPRADGVADWLLPAQGVHLRHGDGGAGF